MQLKGELLVSQLGREAHLKEGDLVMCDSALPYALEYRDPSSTLVVTVSSKDIKQRLPAPETALGQRLDGKSGLTSMLSAMLTGVWEQAQNGLNEEIESRLSSNLLDLFAISCMDAFGGRVSDSAIASARRSQIRCYIESHMKDSNLSVSSIAAAFRISPRYLHMLFTDEEETISSYVRRRRLEECKKRLADSAWMRRSITELAYACGFNNTTHFARVFRDQYGVSPRDYRKACFEQKKEEAVH
jgi:AraC-like DNA-binding protein